MTVLNKKTYEGISVQKAKRSLAISIPIVLFLMGLPLFLLFASHSKPSPSSFVYFVGVDIEEDIKILYDENNSHDEFNLYEVCFKTGSASIEKIITHNTLIQVQDPLAENKAASKCVGNQGTLYRYTKPQQEKNLFTHHEEILIYNQTVQTAWYRLHKVQ